MMLPTISFSREILSRFEDAIQKEWIITNGLGGYASSTVLGINTRKYHGLLVAALHPPGDRRVCLAKLDEEISIGSDIFRLGANEFQNGIFPQGHIFLREFSVSPFPKYTYSVRDVEVEKTVFMPHERNAVVTLYKVLNKSNFDVKIRVFPLVNWRHFHSVTDRVRIPWEFVQKREDREAGVSLGIPWSALIMRATSGHYSATGNWIDRIYFREEARRGESFLDDYYRPGCFEVDAEANKNENFAVMAVADKNETDARRVLAEMPATIHDVEALYAREIERHKNLLSQFYDSYKSIPANNWLSWIILGTDMFIVKGENNKPSFMIAGYHWFETWGRDTFISLPGLMLVTQRFEDARKVFLMYKEYSQNGLIPNFLPDQAGQPVYNSVDATLWYVNAVLQYLKYTGDFKFIREQLWDGLKSIIENHVRGTAFNIHVDNDGLLSHGPQLTWVDAAIDGQPINPRAGKAVEVQALWFNALKTMELLANRFEEKGEAEKYAQMAEKPRKSFVDKFWNSEKNCLFDVVSEDGEDDSVRSNQIIAVALDFVMLDNVRSEGIVDVLHRELLTPYGLRTLARKDPRYIGVYAGDRRSRDKAYHNGTVWSWLLGPFTTAFLRTKSDGEYRREYALRNFLLPLFTEQMSKAGLGTISEIFDGESPHKPRGCIAQAWSVAEPLRAYVEDVMQVRPKHEREVLQDSR